MYIINRRTGRLETLKHIAVSTYTESGGGRYGTIDLCTRAGASGSCIFWLDCGSGLWGTYVITLKYRSGPTIDFVAAVLHASPLPTHFLGLTILLRA